ncbi:MAG TPA: AtpZ/AtpI family protein [Marmoricola sp.]|jgi:F0F1-type ATP synthase assembly protein I|nr:AtpZ/AtpI family protein [Marmoricola sp.]
MTQPDPARKNPDEPPASEYQGDPWHAFAYLVSGVLLYGAAGWLADRWLGTSFLVVIGILFGAGLGIYLTIRRFDAMPGIGRAAREARKHDEK